MGKKDDAKAGPGEDQDQDYEEDTTCYQESDLQLGSQCIRFTTSGWRQTSTLQKWGCVRLGAEQVTAYRDGNNNNWNKVRSTRKRGRKWVVLRVCDDQWPRKTNE